ncbi:MAG: CBS domain-containing protein [Bacteriovorax sp.]|nr:CBS domain-containing protein [Bacteriovorax sp.]
MNDNMVIDFMNSDPLFCKSSTRIAEIKYLLSKYDLKELFVIDDEKHPVGVVSFSDVETDEIESMDIPSDVSAIECMRQIPAVVMNNSTLEESLNVMRANQLESLAVVDGSGHLKGIIEKETITKIIM